MAQRKSPPSGKSTANRGSGGASVKSASRPAGPKGPGAPRPPVKKGKSIVNQKQTPWGLIITTVAVVAFAAAVILVVVVTSGGKDKSSASDDPYRQPALPAATKIQGVRFHVEPDHNHVNGVVKYDFSPPIGGNHSQYWANCNGVVYDQAIANENAVHMLEHGAVWITYNPDKLSAAELAKLKPYAEGQDRVALSPYPGLSSPISLQSWGYQLKLSNPDDPRIAQFIAALKYNTKTTPENASCTDQYFDPAKSTPGHPQD